MSVIEKKLQFQGSKGDKKISALFDSGATYSCIRQKLAEELEILIPLTKTMKFSTADDKTTLTARYVTRLDFYISNDRFSDEFIVIEGLSDDIIIGAATLQKWRMKLDFEHDAILYDPKVTRLRIG
ncbi:MAG TPA: retropepsin-like aspartic protease [Thermodesulfovibrionia bacterium]|nr:retropepsin-like aspartic protease [Thermodesulfovibrionia bacterium]